MPRRLRFPSLLVVLPALLLITATTASAQISFSPSTTRIYRLDTGSGFEDGCFDPCLCPVHLTDTLLGTMRLAPAPPEPGYTVFDVTSVNWLVPGLDWWVTGQGTYRIGGQPAVQRLELDLVVDSRDVQHYDSGWQPANAAGTIALTISMNNMVCHDTVFHLVALPIVPQNIVPYALSHSRYEEGCFGPCDCAVAAWPLSGRLGLLKLGSANGDADFAVLGFDGFVSKPDAASGWRVTGDGLYHVGGNPKTQRLRLDLVENGVGPTRFDSGVVPGDGSLLRFVVDVAQNGFACYDRVYSIDARRRRTSATSFQALHTDPVNPGVVPAP
jgi:hypothetical protein